MWIRCQFSCRHETGFRSDALPVKRFKLNSLSSFLMYAVIYTGHHVGLYPERQRGFPVRRTENVMFTKLPISLYFRKRDVFGHHGIVPGSTGYESNRNRKNNYKKQNTKMKRKLKYNIRWTSLYSMFTVFPSINIVVCHLVI
jgi:hypothetical protein